MEQQEQRERLIPREGLEQARRLLAHPTIVVITGIRRCGKSVFSYLLAKGTPFGYVTFNDERLAGLTVKDMDTLLQALYELQGEVPCIVLDEIQNVPGWELFASRLRQTKQVIVTGSNARLLSGELATHLTGRYIDRILFPFSFREFLEYKGIKPSVVYTTKERAAMLRSIEDYMNNGGFPEVQTFGRIVLPRIYEDVLTKDILLRHHIRHQEPLKKLAGWLMSNVGKEATYQKLGTALGIRHPATVSKWIAAMEQAYLFFRLERFSFSLKQQSIAPKKFYPVDPGMASALGFRFSEDRGRLMEACVAIELQRRKAADRPLEVYYWKDPQQREVDFVLKKGSAVTELVQVTYARAQDDIRNREQEALVKAAKELRCRKLTIITWDSEGEERAAGHTIQYIPLWKWLLAAYEA